MTEEDPGTKWDDLYRRRSYQGLPARVLLDNIDLVPGAGRALDIACGRGANARLLARRGLEVAAWDISKVAIAELQALAEEEGLNVRTRVIDITPADLERECFELIVNCHYLDRALIPAIKASLAPGGLIFFQTFTADRVIDGGPRNPDFLLKPDELPALFADFEILVYRDESANPDPEDALAGRACLVARKADS